MNTSTRHRLWAVLNAFGLVVTLVMNGLANGLPLNGMRTGDLSALYPNLFVPAGLTFSIWGLIYALLFAFVGFQLVSAFKDDGERAALEGIGPWFLASCAANSLWIVAWHYVYPATSLVLMLALLGSLLAMYLRLSIGRVERDALARFLVEVPISVYLGWITVATIANVTAVLVHRGYSELPPGPVFWTVVVIVVAIVLAGLMIFTRKDRAFAGVVVWALLGIVIKRRADTVADDAAIEMTAMVGMVVVVALVVVQAFGARKGDGAKGAPSP